MKCEFPVVFCPFSWEGSLISDREFTFHDPAEDFQLNLDLGSDSRSHHLAQARNELLSENLRLLYVALTRAKQRCYLAWGRINLAETSALAYLLHGDTDQAGEFSGEDQTSGLKNLFKDKTSAELQMSREMLSVTQAKLQKIVPKPDSEVEVFKSDGKVMLVDPQTNIVHLNIGSDDRVYRGLAFSVYDQTMPIPRDGIGKADIEIFDVGKTFSAARIIRSEIKRPIVADDVIANLIWDTEQTNTFVVAGEFDLDDNGSIDYDAIDSLITATGPGGSASVTHSIDVPVPPLEAGFTVSHVLGEPVEFTALAEANVLYVSAQVHSGWDRVGRDGIIDFKGSYDEYLDSQLLSGKIRVASGG